MSVDLLHLWGTMGLFAKGIVFIMAIMSVYSLTSISLERTESNGSRYQPLRPRPRRRHSR